uniref:Uncharacterized protein n=1 Tax=Aegilops tauschii TaxID=37682 RepID=M8BA63_AEGTA
MGAAGGAATTAARPLELLRLVLRWAASLEVMWRGAEDLGVPHADAATAPPCCDDI